MKKIRFKIHWPKVSIGLNRIEKEVAEKGGGWDGLELGKWYKVFVVDVPGEGELTPKGRSKRPICRLKDRDGNFRGRYIVTEIDRPVKLGQELVVLVTTVGTR